MRRRRSHLTSTVTKQRVIPTRTLAHKPARLRRLSASNSERLRRYTLRRKEQIIPIGDRRLYAPASATIAPVTMRGEEALLEPTPPRRPKHSGLQLKFVSKQTAICVRRSRRKQVMFAQGKAGKGYRKKTRNLWSNVKC